jgi:D-specific alpha-keto acid dehydrogenase
MLVTIYGCELDEATVVRSRAPQLGITPVITAEPVSLNNVTLAGHNRCISVGHKAPVSNDVLLALSEAGVQYISTRSIGYDHLDVSYAASVGITVENVAYSPDSVADYTLMLILMGLRNAKSTLLRAQEFDYRLAGTRGRELRDLTVGVVGVGRIGAAVIDRLRGFGCHILANDTRATVAAEYVPLDELLQRSDIVTLHLPLTDDTHHLLDGARLGRMKKNALLINTGRGALIETEALISALEAGTVGGAALDVLEGEDGVFYSDFRNRSIGDDTFSRLQKLPNVVISPHIAYYTGRALTDTVVNSLVNCHTFESRVHSE